MKKKLIFLLSIPVLGYLFLQFQLYLARGEWKITDTSKDTTLIGVNKSFFPVASMKFHIQGETDDSVSLYNGYIKLPKGKIDTIWGPADYYTDTIKVEYKANNAKKGNLKIKYYFAGQ